jgi:hypothetical protein
MASSVPVIDLTRWFGGDEQGRAAVPAEVEPRCRAWVSS